MTLLIAGQKRQNEILYYQHTKQQEKMGDEQKPKKTTLYTLH